MSGRCEPFDGPFSLPGGLMRVLGLIVQVLGSAMLDRGQQLAVRHLGAAELVGDDCSRHIAQARSSSLRKNRLAAFLFRRGWTSSSSTLPCWSTSRRR